MVHEADYPILTSLARDILITPASGSGVERLFNSAHDICYYRWGSLRPQTIQDLMIFMCTARFDIQSEQLALVDEVLYTQERHMKKEQEDVEQKTEYDPISDDEEGPIIASIEVSIDQPNLRALGKRSAIDDQLTELDDHEIPLPDFDMQRRLSGRIPKRLRHDEEFIYN